jgi:FAD/FMN-containing dehydrogenase
VENRRIRLDDGRFGVLYWWVVLNGEEVMARRDTRHAALRGRIESGVILPGDTGYDEARVLWNAEIQRRPEVIVTCRSAQEVAWAVTHAVEGDLEISVRGGGHNTAGLAVGDDGIMIHLGLLNQVRVDPDR